MVVPRDSARGDPPPDNDHGAYIIESDVSSSATGPSGDTTPNSAQQGRRFNFTSFRNLLRRRSPEGGGETPRDETADAVVVCQDASIMDDKEAMRPEKPVKTVSALDSPVDAVAGRAVPGTGTSTSNNRSECDQTTRSSSHARMNRPPPIATQPTTTTSTTTPSRSSAPQPGRDASRKFMFDSREHSTHHIGANVPHALCIHDTQTQDIPDDASPPSCGYVMGEFPRRLGLTDAQYRALMDRHQRFADVTTVVARCRRIGTITSVQDVQDASGSDAQRSPVPSPTTDRADSQQDQSHHDTASGCGARTRVPSPPPPASLNVDLDAEESGIGGGGLSSGSRRSTLREGGTEGSPLCGSPRAALCDPYALFLYHCAMVQQRIDLLEGLATELGEDLVTARARCAHAMRHKRTHRSARAERERQDALEALLCLWRNRANNKLASAAIFTEAVECVGGLPLVAPLTSNQSASSPPASSTASSRRRSANNATKAKVESIMHTPWVTDSQRVARCEFLQDAGRLTAAQETHVRSLTTQLTAAYTRESNQCATIESFMSEANDALFRGEPARGKSTRGHTATPVSWRRRLLEESGDDAVTKLLLEQLFLYNTETDTIMAEGAQSPVGFTASPLTISPGAAGNAGTSTSTAAPGVAPMSPLQLMSSPLRPAIRTTSSYNNFDERYGGGGGIISPPPPLSSARTPAGSPAPRKSTKHVSFQLDDTPTLTARATSATAFCSTAPGHVEQLMTWMASLRATVGHSVSDAAMKLEHVEQVHYFQLIQMGGGSGFSHSAPTTARTQPLRSARSAHSADEQSLNSPNVRAKSAPGSARSLGSDSRCERDGAEEARNARKQRASSSCGDPADCVVM